MEQSVGVNIHHTILKDRGVKRSFCPPDKDHENTLTIQ